jgi:hypothetical protein
MVEANVGGSATMAGDGDGVAPNPAALEADLDARITRLEQLVTALGVVLQRFNGEATFGTTVFESFDDPGASNEALDLLFESTTDAHRDLAVLRQDARLLTEPSHDSAHPLVARVGLLGESATELAGQFERYRRSIGLTVPPRTPGGVGRLDQFVAMVVRALVEIAEVVAVLRPAERRIGVVAGAVTVPQQPPSVAPRQGPRPTATVGRPMTAALWQGVRRRRTRLIAEFAGLAVVGLVILASALGGRGTPGPTAGNGLSGAGPGQTGAVAVGGAPSGSVPPGSSPEPTASGTPPTPRATSAPPPPAGPPSAPEPTKPPAAPSGKALSATRFDNRITAGADSIDALLGTIADAVQADDLAAAESAAEDIEAIATADRAWLQSHPPKKCYRSFYNAALATYAELITTAIAVADDAEAGDATAIHKDVASGHADVTALRQAGNKAVTSCA